jgi:hypothetical protein
VETYLKYTAVRGLSAEALRASVPARYRTQLPSVLPEQEYTLLLFRNERRDVVLSRTVDAALVEVVDPAQPLIVVGGCFTAEGIEMLRRRKAIVLQLSEFYWTDESYQAIREGN